MADVSSVQAGGRTFIGITIRGAGKSPGVADPFSSINDALRELKGPGFKKLFKEVGEFWRSDILPKHFMASNWHEYNIAPRVDQYRLGSKRKYGIGKGKYVANVFSGRTERMARYASDAITSTSHGAKVPVNVPSYFSTPGGKGKQPDKVGETLQVNSRDLVMMNNFVVQRLLSIANDAFSRAA